MKCIICGKKMVKKGKDFVCDESKIHSKILDNFNKKLLKGDINELL